jgi:dTDP-4-amino-4,6-dideoxygalactose transaminase
MNSRLDTIQAAILQVKFKAFKDYEVLDVNKAAKMYEAAFLNAGLDEKLLLPTIKEGYLSSWAQYTVQLPEGIDRSTIQEALNKKDVPTMVYYMKPMHTQGAFEDTYSVDADCPVTENICKRVLSLPIHPYMTEEQVNEVVAEIGKLL